MFRSCDSNSRSLDGFGLEHKQNEDRGGVVGLMDVKSFVLNAIRYRAFT